MKNNSIRNFLALILNIAIVALELAGFRMSVNLKDITSYVWYTIDSNLFLLIVSAVYIIGNLFSVISNKNIPDWIRILRYISTCCVAVTFLTVCLILNPLVGGDMFNEGWLYMHLICPVLSLVSEICFEKEPKLEFENVLFSLIPTILYTINMIILNFAGIVDGPYPFLRVRFQSLLASLTWGVVMFFGALFISLFVWILNKKLFIKKADE